MENTFGSLYDYITSRGIIIPQTSTIKEKVDECFKSIFGNDFELSPDTIGGRLSEAITLLFVDIIGVNAQSYSFLNPYRAIGTALDNIAALFGISRPIGMSDADFRRIILDGHSYGVGFYQSIVNSISNVNGVESVCVLNNGNADPAVIDSLAVDAHSVYICVGGGSDDNVANAILKAMPVGCGYTNKNTPAEYGSRIVKTFDTTQYSSSVIFYRPIKRHFRISFNVTKQSNSTTEWMNEIRTKIRNSVQEYFKTHSTNTEIDKTALLATIISNNIDADIKFSAWYSMLGETGSYSVLGESIQIRPSHQAVIADSDITVNF